MSNDYQEFDEVDFAVMMPKRRDDDERLYSDGKWDITSQCGCMKCREFFSGEKYRRLRSLLTPEQIEHFKRKEAMKPCPENHTRSLCNAAGDTKAADISEADIVITDEVKLISHLQNNGFGYLAHDTLEELLRVLEGYKSKTKPAEISDDEADEAFEKDFDAWVIELEISDRDKGICKIAAEFGRAWRDARK